MLSTVLKAWIHLDKSVNKTGEDFVVLKLPCMREADKKLQLRSINTTTSYAGSRYRPESSELSVQGTARGLLMAMKSEGTGESPRRERQRDAG